MKSSTPLRGIDLVDCAQANAKLGLAIATRQCGYGENSIAFQKELKQAGEELGLKINNLEDLRIEPAQIKRGNDFSPDTSSQL